jgi:starch-binding outer membrane protein, SusD/RagB family
MKNIETIELYKKLCLLLILVVITTSCEDWIDRRPIDGLIRNEYWQNKENVQAVLMGAYTTFAKMDENLFLYGEIRGDMIETNSGSGVAGYILNVEEANIFSNNKLSNWSEFYKVINYCNHVIKYAPGVLEVDDTFNEYESQTLVSEALFLRSLAYFYLVRIFKDVPLVLEPTDTDALDFFPTKSLDIIILRKIEQDLLVARVSSRGHYSTHEDSKGRSNRAAINALLADISLWKAAITSDQVQADSGYNACLEYIGEIENDENSSYLLLPPSNWFDNFYPGNSIEGIFEFQMDQGLGQANTMYTYTWTQKYFAPTEYALEMLLPELSREVIRGYGSISVEHSNSGYKIFKYYGSAPDQTSKRSGTDARSCNWMVYRYADILLMKAEALSQRSNPDFGQAELLLNELRIRAGMESISASFTREKFEDAILEERSKELAFEGKRWYDLLRMGMRNNFARRSKLIETIVQKVPSTQKLVLASKLSDPNGWFLPISENEIERNSNLVQNPYYDD